MTRFLLILILGALFLGSSRTATAGHFFCNETGEEVNISVGWWDGKQWLSKGWFIAQPTECVSTWVGVAHNRYAYFYAESVSGNLVWDGKGDSTGGYFCAPSRAFFIQNDSTNCDGFEFRKVDMEGADQYTTTLTESRTDPRQAAENCRERISSGRAAFARCWIRSIASSKQRAILGCYDRSKTNEEFAICANRDSLSESQYQLVNCAAEYNRTKIGADFVRCVSGGQLSGDAAQVFDCAVRNRGSYSMMAECTVGGQLSAQQQRIYSCVADHFNDYVAAGMCAASENLSAEEARIAECVLSNRGSYASMGVCAAGGNLTPEQQVFAECAITTGGEPYSFAGCVGTQLTMNELEKCMTQGVGGSGCFGDNNTIVKTVSNAWKDVTEGPGPNNDLLGRDGWVGRNLRNVQNDIEHGPGENNDLVGKNGFVCKTLFGGC